MDEKRFGRLWVFIAAIVLLVGLFPLQAIAAATDGGDASTTVEISGSVEWENYSYGDSYLPDTVTIRLYANNVEINQATVSNSTNWKYSFKDLPAYISSDSSDKINYTIAQDHIASYNTKYNDFTVINTLETVSYTATFDWDDDGNRDGFRANSINVTLKAGKDSIDTVPLPSEGSWTFTWENLAKSDSSGEEINYSLDEDAIQSQIPSGYDINVNHGAYSTTYGLRHNPWRIDISIGITWVGDEGKNTRPDYVEFPLFEDGKPGHMIMLRPGNSWYSMIPGLYIYNDGQQIDYQWGYSTINHYTLTDEDFSDYEGWRTYTYSSPVTLHFTSLDGELMDAIKFDVLDPDNTTIEQAINDHFGTTKGTQYEPFVKEGYYDSVYRVTRPLTAYKNYQELVDDDIDFATNKYVGDGVELYYVMLKEIEDTPEVTIEAPVCGTETTTPRSIVSSAYDLKQQTNPPQVTTPNGAHYRPDDRDGYLPGWWRNGPEDTDPFIGTFMGGDTYYADVKIVADFGYIFADDDLSINGGDLVKTEYFYDTHSLSFGDVVKLTAVHDAADPVDENFSAADCTTDGTHDSVVRCKECSNVISSTTVVDEPKLGHQWGDWKITKKPTTTEAGEEIRECTRCDAKETRDTDPLPVVKGTLTFDLGGGTLDDKTGKITIEANVGDIIKLPGAPTRKGFTFKYWKGSEYAAGADYTVDGDHTFTAVWEAETSPVKKATLTFDLDGGTLDGKTGKVSVEANVGDTVKLLGAPTRDGYTFKYWKGSEYAAGAEYKVDGDHTFTAVWEKNASNSGSNLPKTSDPSMPASVLVGIAVVGVIATMVGYAIRRKS